MKVTALLANHVEAVNNLLYANGAGINRTFVPPGAPAPFGVHLHLGVIVEVPWTETNQNQTLLVEPIDADGHGVPVPAGPATSEPFIAEMPFNVGRPPALEVGEEQTIALTIGMPGLPLPALGQYRFVIRIDQTQQNELPFRIVTQPSMTGVPGGNAQP